MTTVGVAGYLLRHPVGGNAWTFGHYIAGLTRLGLDVFYVEESGWDRPCFDPQTGTYGDDPTRGLERARDLLTMLGVTVPLFYVDRRDGAVFGGDRTTLERLLGRTELLVDVGGVCDLPEFEMVACRALVDLDPMFTQAGRFGGDRLERYDVHFSYGVNIGQEWCPIPTHGFTWHPTVPPVILSAWASSEPPRQPPVFTTVANLDAYGPVRVGGRLLGQKSEQLRKILDLPSRSAYQLELALSGVSAEMTTELRSAGWHVSVAARLDGAVPYRRFIQGSAGEFSVAKQAYVATGSGWVSDRTVTYLAAGRPAIVEDTSIGTMLPVGEGLLTFSSTDEAAAALEDVHRRPDRHAAAAMRLAGEHFAAEVVLDSLVNRALSAHRAMRVRGAPPRTRPGAREPHGPAP